jgi:hypothetical protein
MTDDERAAFNTEVTRKATWLLATLSEKVAEGKIEPGVAIAALMVAAVNLAKLHGSGPATAAWLRSQIPHLTAMMQADDAGEPN